MVMSLLDPFVAASKSMLLEVRKFFNAPASVEFSFGRKFGVGRTISPIFKNMEAGETNGTSKLQSLDGKSLVSESGVPTAPSHSSQVGRKILEQKILADCFICRVLLSLQVLLTVSELLFSLMAFNHPGNDTLVMGVPNKTAALSNKAALPSISVQKSRFTFSSDNGTGFTYPISASQAAFPEPQTPSIMPSSSGNSLPLPPVDASPIP